MRAKTKSLEDDKAHLQKEVSDESSDIGSLRAKLREAEQLLELARKEAADMHDSYDRQSKELFDKSMDLDL